MCYLQTFLTHPACGVAGEAAPHENHQMCGLDEETKNPGSFSMTKYLHFELSDIVQSAGNALAVLFNNASDII
jgi:hypothetical protein